jgi:hypothetical protein
MTVLACRPPDRWSQNEIMSMSCCKHDCEAEGAGERYRRILGVAPA